jgi:hypothetical protein
MPEWTLLYSRGSDSAHTNQLADFVLAELCAWFQGHVILSLSRVREQTVIRILRALVGGKDSIV